MKRFALRLMRGCGIFAATRMLSANVARVLMYHNFSDHGQNADAVCMTALRSQLEYLRRHFSVVPLAQVIECLKSRKRLQSHIAALTIDDGRRNCFEVLFPLLKEFGMPATFFVVSSFIRGEDWLWTDKVLWLSQQPLRPSQLAPAGLDGFFQMLNRMRPEVRTAHVEAIAKGMGVAIPKRVPPEYAACSWAELRQMADSGLVEIGSHTVSHPILSSVSDEESWRELTLSRAQIEEGIGRSVTSFCFPNGQPGDYRPTQVQQIRDAGYTSAVTAHSGMVSRRSDPYELPRIGVSGRTDGLDFAKHVDGAEYYQAKLQRSMRPARA